MRKRFISSANMFEKCLPRVELHEIKPFPCYALFYSPHHNIRHINTVVIPMVSMIMSSAYFFVMRDLYDFGWIMVENASVVSTLFLLWILIVLRHFLFFLNAWRERKSDE